MVTDPIADFITRLKNGNMAKNAVVLIPQTKVIEAIANVLEKEGFIGAITKKKIKDAKVMEIAMKYDVTGAPKIQGVDRISKSSRRLYRGAKDIKAFKNNFGISVFSTPNGILSGRDAKKANVGGEHLFNIW